MDCATAAFHARWVQAAAPLTEGTIIEQVTMVSGVQRHYVVSRWAADSDTPRHPEATSKSSVLAFTMVDGRWSRGRLGERPHRPWL